MIPDWLVVHEILKLSVHEYAFFLKRGKSVECRMRVNGTCEIKRKRKENVARRGKLSVTFPSREHEIVIKLSRLLIPILSHPHVYNMRFPNKKKIAKEFALFLVVRNQRIRFKKKNKRTREWKSLTSSKLVLCNGYKLPASLKTFLTIITTICLVNFSSLKLIFIFNRL